MRGLSLAASNVCPELFALRGGGDKENTRNSMHAYPYKKVKAEAGILLSMLSLKFLQSHFPTGKMADTFLSTLSCKS